MASECPARSVHLAKADSEALDDGQCNDTNSFSNGDVNYDDSGDTTFFTCR